MFSENDLIPIFALWYFSYCPSQCALNRYQYISSEWSVKLFEEMKKG